MKITLLATMIALAAAPAFAGEGNGEPFPLVVQGVTTRLTAGPVGSSQNPFPYGAAGTPVTMTRGIAGSSQNPFPWSAPGQRLTLISPTAPATAMAQHGAHPSGAAPSTGG